MSLLDAPAPLPRDPLGRAGSRAEVDRVIRHLMRLLDEGADGVDVATRLGWSRPGAAGQVLVEMARRLSL